MIRIHPNKCILVVIILFLAMSYTQQGLAGTTHAYRVPPVDQLYTYRAIITSVYDGDTVTADIDLGMKIWLRGERLRLWGIDTPELNRGANRALAREARDFLRELILGRRVIIKTIKDRKGKYGRYLAIIYKGEININELMVSKSYARRYMTRR